MDRDIFQILMSDDNNTKIRIKLDELLICHSKGRGNFLKYLEVYEQQGQGYLSNSIFHE